MFIPSLVLYAISHTDKSVYSVGGDNIKRWEMIGGHFGGWLLQFLLLYAFLLGDHPQMSDALWLSFHFLEWGTKDVWSLVYRARTFPESKPVGGPKLPVSVVLFLFYFFQFLRDESAFYLGDCRWLLAFWEQKKGIRDLIICYAVFHLTPLFLVQWFIPALHNAWFLPVLEPLWFSFSRK